MKLAEYIDFLKLKKRVNLHITTRKNKFADAYYEPKYSIKTGKLLEHNITIYLKNTSRDFETLLAHELIHAWQEENKKSEIHGEYFIKYAKKMERAFNLREIYLENIDLN